MIIIWAFFMIFAQYTLLVFRYYTKQQMNEPSLKKMQRSFLYQLEHEHIFMYGAMIIGHIVVPTVPMAGACFMYVLTLWVSEIMLYCRQKTVLALMFWIQNLLCLMCYLMIMSDDWCRFYLYRGHA
jgi:hypothetical protein